MTARQGNGERPAGPSLRLRLGALALAVVVVLAGLGVRSQFGGAFAKYAGIALYAALVYAIVVCLAPRVAPRVAGTVALLACWAVELAQLTPGPAALSARSALARLVLGSTFNWPDLPWYAVGVALVFGLHRAVPADRT